MRGKPELFAEHYGQARLFWQSQTPVEQAHIVNAYRFELTRVQTPAVRERIVAGLANIDAGLANAVASQLGIAVPAPLPRATELPIPDYQPSPPLSLLARPGKTGIRTRRIAVLVAAGVDGDTVRELYAALLKEGAQPRLVGQRLGKAESMGGHPLDIEITLETSPAVMYDALVLPPGDAAMLALSRDGRALEFVREQYRHLKPILALGNGAGLLQAAGIPPRLPDGGEDWGLILGAGEPAAAFAAFKAAIVRHRVYERETDPPRV